MASALAIDGEGKFSEVRGFYVGPFGFWPIADKKKGKVLGVSSLSCVFNGP